MKANFSLASLVFLTARSANSNGSPRAAAGESIWSQAGKRTGLLFDVHLIVKQELRKSLCVNVDGTATDFTNY